MIVTRSRTSFTSSWLHNRHATHVACIRRRTYACIPPSEPRPLQPDAPREPLRPDVSQQSKPKAKTKPFTFTASHSQPDLSRRPNPDRGHSQPLERACSRRSEAPTGASLMVRVGATPRHRPRATAGAAHRHPSPRNGRGRPTTTSPKEEEPPARKLRRGHTARPGNP